MVTYYIALDHNRHMTSLAKCRPQLLRLKLDRLLAAQQNILGSTAKQQKNSSLLRYQQSEVRHSSTDPSNAKTSSLREKLSPWSA